MTHILSFFDKPHLAAADLGGEDTTLTIVKIEQVTVGADKRKKARLHFKEPVKPMICNITNAHTINAIYGEASLVGKQITLFEAMDHNPAGQLVPCIRVREQAPDGNGQPQAQPPDTDEMSAGWLEVIAQATSRAEVDRLLKQAGLLGLPEPVMQKIRVAAEVELTTNH